MIYLLDTDTCIAVLREGEPALSRVRVQSPADLALATMTVAELWFGARNSQHPDAARLRLDAFLAAPYLILPFDRAAAEVYAETRFSLRATPVGTADLITASTARANGVTVITNNEREFSRIPGLAWENWMRH